jgi:hypothetical protein
MATRLVCTTRTLSPAQRANANSMAASLGLRESDADDSMSPARRLIEAARENTGGISPAVIAVVKASYWGKRGARLTTGFMDNPPRDLRREILRHLNMWGTRANVRFVESSVDPTVRIDRRTGPKWGGYWSYVGTDVLGVDEDEPTMNLEGFTMRTSPSEFRRVVCHEAGHTLGFPHEHMRKELVQRIDPAKAYPYFRMSDGWSQEDVDDQVLSPLNQRTIVGTPVDQTSIMCYQLPGSITRDGKPILGGTRINETDYRFAAVIYPLPQRATGGARSKRAAKKSKPRKKSTRRKSTRRTAAKKSAAKKRTPARRATKRTKSKRGRA